MKKIILFISMVLLSSLLFTNVVTANDYTPQFEEQAETLKELGLFYGTNIGFELNRQPTRLEALVMLIRLLGLENEVETLKDTEEIPFTDVPDWGKAYVAYAFRNKLTYGNSETEFGSNSFANEAQFLTFVLRSLGYDDTNGDFIWSSASEKAAETGLLTQEYLKNKPAELMRDGCVAISTQALKTKLKDKNEVLLSKLLDRGAVEESKTKKLLTEAEYYALIAAKAYQKRQVTLAEEHYKKAVMLDPLEAEYQINLAEIYNSMVKASDTTATEQIAWIVKQRNALEKAVSLDSKNVNYVKALMEFYFDHKDFEKALQQAESYYLLSKKQEDAYEWLARGYSEYGIQLVQKDKVVEGKGLLDKALELINIKSISNNKTVMFYVGKSYLAYGQFEKAEAFFQKARTNQDLKKYCDWLLVLINDETGRTAENEKYRGVFGMGSVLDEPKTNTLYLEMKNILNSKVLT